MAYGSLSAGVHDPVWEAELGLLVGWSRQRAILASVDAVHPQIRPPTQSLGDPATHL
jgi:hypothetical protein